MKVLKKIVIGRPLKADEMNSLTGGNMSNVNDASGCDCSGSTQGWFWCDDNTNEARDCKCSGNDDNTNKLVSCTCGDVSGVGS